MLGRRIVLAVLPALLVAGLYAPPAGAEGVVFLTLHAEKSLEVPGGAAPLLPEGVARARTLAALLADARLHELLTPDPPATPPPRRTVARPHRAGTHRAAG